MNQEIRSKLDRICNVLYAGGLAVPTLFVEQISYLIYLKLLDERENELETKARLLKNNNGNDKSLFPDQATRYRWSNWRFKSGKELRDFLRDQVFPYMASLLKEQQQVAIYFQDARMEIDDAHVLKEAIDILDGFHFAKLGPDVKGDIFEYLLQYLAKQPQSDMGQFRTPRQIRVAMVEMVDPDFGDTIYDPACGTAGMLIDALEHLLAKYSTTPREVPIYGDEWLDDKGLTLAQAKKQIPNLQTYLKGAGEKIPDWAVLEHSIYGIEVSRQMMRIFPVPVGSSHRKRRLPNSKA
jgi:type I restriction enzyme M protein